MPHPKTPPLPPKMIANFGVSLGYDSRDIVQAIRDETGCSEDEARDVLARAEEGRLGPGE